MQQCPHCDGEVSHTARSCPHCGHQLFWTKIKNVSLRGVLLSCLVVVLGVSALILMVYLSSGESDHGQQEAATLPPPRHFHHSFPRFYADFEYLTDIQRKDLWKEYKGECVEWAGAVWNVKKSADGDSYVVTVEQDLENGPYNPERHVWVYFPPERKSYLFSFERGDSITYQGTLTQYPSIRAANSSNDVTKVVIGC